jgi:hypothetical protein
MQWLTSLVAGADINQPPQDVVHAAAQDRLSIHWTGRLDIRDWLGIVRRVLEKFGQSLPEGD